MKRCIPVFGNLCFLFAVVLTSCGTGIKDDHPEHFEHFFTRLNTTSGQTKRLVFDSLDIAIHQLPAGVGDKARYYWAKGLYYMEGSRYDLTFAYFDSLELTIRGRTDEERFRDLHWNSLLTRSKCYENLGNYEAGLKTLLASKMVLLPGDKCGNFSVDSRTAIMLYQQERFLLAAHYFLKMYANAPVCHSGEKLFLTRQGSLDNAGLCYAAVGMLDSAMYYYNATLNYLTQSEREFPAKKSFIELARGIVYGNMADVKARQLDFEAAEALSFASIKAVKKEDANFTSTTQLNLANAYIAWNKLDKAHAILFELDSSRAFEKRDIAMIQKRMAWNLSMKKLFEKAGNLPEAYSYNNQYLAIRDSLDMIRKRDISRDIGTAFENMEQRAINERLETSNREKSFQLAIALLTAVLAIAIGLFVWYNLRRSSKHVKQLQKLNTQVQEKTTT